MNLNPDVPLWPEAPFPLNHVNATLLYSWVVMGLLTGLSAYVTRDLSTGPRMSRLQNLLEVIVGGVRQQIEEITNRDAASFLPFIGTLFLFIATSNLLAVVPGFQPPTSSLSTTAALAACVFLAVPIYGIRSQGWRAYFAQYLQPTPLMLPFNIIGEFTRTLALAVRLYGNMLSGTVIGLVLLIVAPFFVPVIMHAFGMLTGLIQAYIFAVLAMVYIASGMQAHEETAGPQPRTAASAAAAGEGTVQTRSATDHPRQTPTDTERQE
ncbi:MAG: F0F1 ATP synthase subunit A [Planctomycetota bacterium]|nr:MAG: F0F1 ATP synthase subunit A [Planctomycetota bacterium]